MALGRLNGSIRCALFLKCSNRIRAAMHADPDAAPVEIRLREAELIAGAYHRAAQGDAWEALVAAIADALADLDEAERRMAWQGRMISRGYARCRAEIGRSGAPPRPDRP
jgi:3-methyladenine DNA glycosylase/8-oxoguanine DNA glycosylase